MRILFKLLFKLLMFVGIIFLSSKGIKGAGLFGGGANPSAILGADGAPVSKEENDLTGTVFSSAMKLVTGQASRSELAKDLSEKLYGQRGDPSEMAELGIDLVGPKSGASPGGGPDLGKLDGLLSGMKQGDKPGAQPGAKPGTPATVPKGAPATAKPGTQPAGKPGTATAGAQKAAPGDPKAGAAAGKAVPGADLINGKSKAALSQVWDRIKPYKVELSLVPVVFIAMVWVSKRRKRKQQASFVPEYMAVLPEADTETHEMKHRVHSLTDEEFELVAAMIYQRQGYRVSMPSALGGGRMGNFKLSRKSERLVVKCMKMDAEQRVQVEQVRELHEAMTDGSITGGLYVASCGFTWDAKHFAKTRKIRLINAKTLDALLDEVQSATKEDPLSIPQWIQKFMTKAEMTAPHCPECEAEMDLMKSGENSAWLCSQRPECSGRRAVRKYSKSARAPRTTENAADSAMVAEVVQATLTALATQPVQIAPSPAVAVPEAKPVDNIPAETAAPQLSSEAERSKDAENEKPAAPTENIVRSIVPELQRVFLPGTLAPKAKSNGTAGEEKEACKDAHASAETRSRPDEKSAVPQRPSPVPGTASIPAFNAQPGPQSPAGEKIEGPKNNHGLLNSVAADFRRRGFRLENAKPSPPAKTARPADAKSRNGNGVPARTAAPNQAPLRLERTRPAPPKPESNAA